MWIPEASQEEPPMQEAHSRRPPPQTLPRPQHLRGFPPQQQVRGRYPAPMPRLLAHQGAALPPNGANPRMPTPPPAWPGLVQLPLQIVPQVTHKPPAEPCKTSCAEGKVKLNVTIICNALFDCLISAAHFPLSIWQKGAQLSMSQLVRILGSLG